MSFSFHLFFLSHYNFAFIFYSYFFAIETYYICFSSLSYPLPAFLGFYFIIFPSVYPFSYVFTISFTSIYFNLSPIHFSLLFLSPILYALFQCPHYMSYTFNPSLFVLCLKLSCFASVYLFPLRICSYFLPFVYVLDFF